jgi:CHAT domain/SIR2-like domain
MLTYPELEVGLHRWDAEAWTIELRFTDPESDGFDSSATTTELVDFQRLRELLADDDAYGIALGEALLNDPGIRERFAAARAVAQRMRLPLRIRLFVGPSAPELHQLHWETLREPVEQRRLFTDEGLLISRFLPSVEGVSVPFRPRDELRALVVVANPSDLARYRLAPLDTEAELARARTGLGGIDATELPGRGRATLGDIVSHMRAGYDVLFLVCHGAARDGEAQLWLEDEDGATHRVPGRELADRIRELSHRPRLVVLASCQSAGDGQGQDGGALATLGPRLARAGVPAVIAMQGNVTKRTVDAFMATFFAELQHDGQIDRALSAARAAVWDLGRSDWWMPVLFLALKSGRIWYEPGFEGQSGGADHEMQKWPTLLRSIREGRCTPILGPGLAESYLGSRREIARRLASIYRYPMANFERENLPQVAQYLAVHQDPEFLRGELAEQLRRDMLQLYGDNLPDEARREPLDRLMLAEGRRRRKQDPSEPHRILAELPFPLYVTAGWNDLLRDALVDEGRKPEVELCRYDDDLELPPPVYDDDVEPDYVPSVERPLVYHVFGRLAHPESVVLTEDDYFDFLIGVTRNNDMIPHFVRSALTHTALLFLGFRLDEWEFRVLFRSLMSQEGRSLRKKFSHVAVQIDPEEGQMSDPEGARRYLSSYFSDARITIYWGSAETFVRELKKRAGGRLS